MASSALCLRILVLTCKDLDTRQSHIDGWVFRNRGNRLLIGFNRGNKFALCEIAFCFSNKGFGRTGWGGSGHSQLRLVWNDESVHIRAAQHQQAQQNNAEPVGSRPTGDSYSIYFLLDTCNHITILNKA